MKNFKTYTCDFLTLIFLRKYFHIILLFALERILLMRLMNYHQPATLPLIKVCHEHMHTQWRLVHR